MSLLKIKEVEIHNFRAFKDISFKMGNKLTVIAGHNATGKSTLLGLLGHCAELKKKDGKPILQNQFNTKFSELFNISNKFDKRCSKAFTIFLNKDDSRPFDSVSFRTGWWEDNTRFRILPKKTPKRNTERKIEWPTFYLGLSRLYPVGESVEAKTSNIRLTDNQKEKFFNIHKNILSLNEDPLDYSAITIQETTKKTIGISTEKYDSICNSAGQDNLSQIIFAVMSFELLKEQRGDKWNGGLLLIDELDATLHPAAQNKLVKFLYDSAKNLQIQIVFTTHSLSMLNYICQKSEHNKPDAFNNYEIVYLTSRNGILQLLPEPNYDTIYYDMLNTLSILPINLRKITVYMEDNEARWLFKKLVSKHLKRIKLPKIKIGQDELLKLFKEDYKHFSTTLFVLDGDVNQDKIDKIKDKFGSYANIIKLPGGTSPEKLLFNYLKNLPGDHEIFQDHAATGLSKRSLSENGPDSYTEFSTEREKYKHWFNIFIEILEEIYVYWEYENQEIADEFQDYFVSSFNNIAKRINIPKINNTYGQN